MTALIACLDEKTLHTIHAHSKIAVTFQVGLHAKSIEKVHMKPTALLP
jgi:hypothetical protein